MITRREIQAMIDKSLAVKEVQAVIQEEAIIPDVIYDEPVHVSDMVIADTIWHRFKPRYVSDVLVEIYNGSWERNGGGALGWATADVAVSNVNIYIVASIDDSLVPTVLTVAAQVAKPASDEWDTKRLLITLEYDGAVITKIVRNKLGDIDGRVSKPDSHMDSPTTYSIEEDGATKERRLYQFDDPTPVELSDGDFLLARQAASKNLIYVEHEDDVPDSEMIGEGKPSTWSIEKDDATEEWRLYDFDDPPSKGISDNDKILVRDYETNKLIYVPTIWKDVVENVSWDEANNRLVVVRKKVRVLGTADLDTRYPFSVTNISVVTNTNYTSPNFTQTKYTVGVIGTSADDSLPAVFTAVECP